MSLNGLKVVVVIPARMESTRFPGKPLKKILGTEMVVHCLKRSQMSSLVDDVVVATCNVEIQAAVEAVGGRAFMTSNQHQRCTDRVAEAIKYLQFRPDIVVIVQGDEPMVHPEMIDQSILPFKADSNLSCTNLIAPILDDAEFMNPNTIKVVLNKRQEVLYMSREPIPTSRLARQDSQHRFKQVCIMGFRTQALELFCDLPPAKLEELESIDMNRFLYHGVKILGVPTSHQTSAVDTEADLIQVERKMKSDPFVDQYVSQ